jgi:O-methyltransferase
LIRPLLRRAAHAASDRVVGPWLFDLYRRERLARREFFYNAFKALRFNGIHGDYAEFGSWGGMTFALAYEESRRHGHGAKLWAFDSFRGFPTPREADAHPEWAEGKMAITLEQFRAVCASRGIPDEAYTVVPGFYEGTLASMSPTEEPTDIALAYVDCDLYSSTKTVLEFLQPRLKHGMIVAFDDYFCWSSSQLAGERKAMLELSAADETWTWAPYIQYGWHGQSFVIEATALAGPAQSEAATLEPPPT